MNCPYKENQHLPCVVMQYKRGGYLKEFLTDNSKRSDYVSIIHEIKCVDNKDSYISINKNCIKCLFCLANCPGNNFSIDKNFNIAARCDEFTDSDRIQNIQNIKGFLNNGFITTPEIEGVLTDTKYNNLNSFNEVNETEHISVWAAALLKNLAKSDKVSLGLEINMLIKTRDRGGRMDICLLINDEHLFIFESKVSFLKMMQEDRYLSQVIGYREEIDNTIQKLEGQKNIKHYETLLIDGNEKDLLYSEHPECTSRVGNQSDIFYKKVENHNLFFMSATALWSLAIRSLFIDERKYNLKNIYNKINKTSGIVGILSAGFIKRSSDNKYSIIPIDEYLD